MNDPDDHDTIDELAAKLGALTGGYTKLGYEDRDKTAFLKKVLDKTFFGLIGVTMFLCFFSLSASMSANLY